MTTFNLALIFGNGMAVTTIVCHNENGLNTEDIMIRASEGLVECEGVMCSPTEYANIVCKKINDNCNCTAVVVNADVSTHISLADASK